MLAEQLRAFESADKTLDIYLWQWTILENRTIFFISSQKELHQGKNFCYNKINLQCFLELLWIGLIGLKAYRIGKCKNIKNLQSFWWVFP